MTFTYYAESPGTYINTMGPFGAYLFFTNDQDVRIKIFAQILDDNVNLTTPLNIGYKIISWNKNDIKEVEILKNNIKKSTILLDSHCQVFYFNESVEIKDVRVFTIQYKYTHPSGSSYSLRNESNCNFLVEYL